MPSVPAFCDTCGSVFDSGVVFDNSTNVSFSGVGAGPCPVCDGTGHVPDGVFNFIGETIEILSAPERTVAELTQLSKILQEAQEKGYKLEEVTARIERELPALVKLGALLLKNRADLYGVLAVVLAAAQLLQTYSLPPPVTISVTQVINQAARLHC